MGDRLGGEVGEGGTGGGCGDCGVEGLGGPTASALLRPQRSLEVSVFFFFFFWVDAG